MNRECARQRKRTYWAAFHGNAQRDEDKTLMFKNACLYTYGLVANLAFRMYSVVMTEEDTGGLLDLSYVFCYCLPSTLPLAAECIKLQH